MCFSFFLSRATNQYVQLLFDCLERVFFKTGARSIDGAAAESFCGSSKSLRQIEKSNVRLVAVSYFTQNKSEQRLIICTSVLISNKHEQRHSQMFCLCFYSEKPDPASRGQNSFCFIRRCKTICDVFRHTVATLI